ncbi:MAG: CopG family transcriptional regulator [Deltaproteobacteria bacterium]|nr:CopG family transcriptional regulator [Deltaproteobacteria bacterium]
MKKDTVVTVRITEEMKKAIQSIADKDERTVGWMIRKLLTEALESRGLVKVKKTKQG